MPPYPSVALVYLGRHGMGGPLAAALAQGLAAQGWPLRAVVSAYSEALPLWEGAAFPVLRVPTYRHLGSMVAATLRGHALRRIVTWLRQDPPQVLLFPMFHPWNLGIQRALPHIPSVAVVHDPHPHPMLYDRLAARIERFTLSRAARIVALSQAMARVMVRQGYPAAQVDVAPLERLLAHPQAHLQGPQADPPTVLFFGRITRYKGVEVLLEAMGRVWEQLPQARLHIVGSGNLRPYAAWLRRHQGDPRVMVRQTWVPDAEIPAVFRQASVVALPYTSATQSGVAVLAASFGIPVVVTATGALPEQVEPGVSGWVVPPSDATALANALVEALSAPQEAHRRGQHLWQRLAAPEAQAAALTQLGESLLRASGL